MSSLFNWSIALLDRIIDSPGTVADLTNLFVIFITNFLLGWFILSDVGVVTLFHRPVMLQIEVSILLPAKPKAQNM